MIKPMVNVAPDLSIVVVGQFDPVRELNKHRVLMNFLSYNVLLADAPVASRLMMLAETFVGIHGLTVQIKNIIKPVIGAQELRFASMENEYHYMKMVWQAAPQLVTIGVLPSDWRGSAQQRRR